MARKKMTSEFVVVRLNDTDTFLLQQDALSSSADARKWIKEHGEDGARYQVAILRGAPVQVKVEELRKVSLVPVGGSLEE